jgi:hypothetical protein
MSTRADRDELRIDVVHRCQDAVDGVVGDQSRLDPHARRPVASELFS